jgi:hypothetical protein
METNHSQVKTQLLGFITEVHLDAADLEFPGIKNFYYAEGSSCRTFLELVVVFERTRTPTSLG